MKNHGKKVGIIFVTQKKKDTYFTFLELYREFHKNMINLDRWYNAAMQTFF
jgi:hypothetical protein